MSPHLSRPALRRLWPGGLLVCCTIFLATGCGPDYKSRGLVRGKVTIGKKALTTGTVMFVNADGVSSSATIDPEGNYEMKDAPLGECKVTVSVPSMPMDPSTKARLKGKGLAMPEGPKNPEAAGPELPSAPRVPKEVVQIPQKYANAETSELKFTVKKGEQTYDIPL